MSAYLLTLLSIAIALACYIPYIKGTLRNTTKPEASSWIVWGALTMIIFAAQLSSGGGVGSLVAGFSGITCFGIALLAINKERSTFSKLDKVSLAGALVAIISWLMLKNPVVSVVLVTIIDVIGFVPTYYKAFERPYEDQETMYGLGAIKFTLSMFALKSLNITTVLYPFVTVFLNSILFLMIVLRRRATAHTSNLATELAK